MTTRQARRRQRVLAEGGSQLAILLDREATDALRQMQDSTGETKTAIVHRLIRSSESVARIAEK